MNTLTSGLLRVEKKLAAKRGGFRLFALFLREDAAGYWDLVVAAPWAPYADRHKARKRIATALNEELKIDDIVRLSGIMIVRESNPSVVELNREFRTEHEVIELRDREFFGMFMRQAFIFTSQPRVANGARVRRSAASSERRRSQAG